MLPLDIFDHLQCCKIGDFVVVSSDRAVQVIESKVQSIVCGNVILIRAFCSSSHHFQGSAWSLSDTKKEIFVK